MAAREFQSNRELFDYLVQLSDILRSKGEADLADQVWKASRFASGPPSEFLYEAEAALRSVRQTCVDRSVILDEAELEQAGSAVRQIQIAFMRIGGA
jgi:hypothetical protein